MLAQPFDLGGGLPRSESFLQTATDPLSRSFSFTVRTGPEEAVNIFIFHTFGS